MCIYYRKVQRELRQYERGEAEEAERRQAGLAAAYGPMEKEIYLRGVTEQEVEQKTEEHVKVEAESLPRCGEEKRQNEDEMESPLSGVLPGWAAQMAPEVPQVAVGEQTQIDGVIPLASGSVCSLTVENLWLHDRGVLSQTEVLRGYDWGDAAMGSDGDGQGDPTEPPSEVHESSSGPTLKGAGIPAICGLRVTNGNEANSVE